MRWGDGERARGVPGFSLRGPLYSAARARVLSQRYCPPIPGRALVRHVRRDVMDERVVSYRIVSYRTVSYHNNTRVRSRRSRAVPTPASSASVSGGVPSRHHPCSSRRFSPSLTSVFPFLRRADETLGLHISRLLLVFAEHLDDGLEREPLGDVLAAAEHLAELGPESFLTESPSFSATSAVT